MRIWTMKIGRDEAIVKEDGEWCLSKQFRSFRLGHRGLAFIEGNPKCMIKEGKFWGPAIVSYYKNYTTFITVEFV